eukprot:CAMPEP_0118935852 /NCGR_PEP_ID=MMETSP1169-20130426/15871_1 /TAXON_ID=36882 /ORGANISM="Pyramimonas obovata, Strain CCMP722" /LENGTH=169 /DNA_ID=CAMNT_0006878927 /DNA_START=29 /DNA_END=535 /DNA_ORIENTATION=+
MTFSALAASLTGLASRTKGTLALAERLVHASAVSSRRSFSTDTSGTAEVARLTGRGVLRFSGNDTLTFLQGLITNDTRLLTPKAATTDVPPPMYAAFLHPQGRFLYDIFLQPQQSADGTPLLLGDVDSNYLPELLTLLKKYKLRTKIDISDVSEEYSVWTQFSRGGDGL